MPASDYQLASKGGLKLKGGGSEKKKKKKSSMTKKLREGDELSGSREGSAREQSPVEAAGSSSTKVADGKTEAQRRFEEVQRKRLLDKAAKAAAKSHKERVAEFNEKLENMSEHYDIPKAGDSR